LLSGPVSLESELPVPLLQASEFDLLEDLPEI